MIAWAAEPGRSIGKMTSEFRYYCNVFINAKL
jgi:hypothetical protein